MMITLKEISDILYAEDVKQLELPQRTDMVEVVERPIYKNASPYKVSTMTLCATLGLNIILDCRCFYYYVVSRRLLDKDDTSTKGIVYIHYLTMYEGVGGGGVGKAFDNQCNMKIRCGENIDDIATIKLFQNGSLHFTGGLKSEQEALYCASVIGECVLQLQLLSRAHGRIMYPPSSCLKYNRMLDYQKANNTTTTITITVMFGCAPILLKILSALGHSDILMLSCVCKKMSKLFSSSNHRLWQTMINRVMKIKNGGNCLIKQNKQVKRRTKGIIRYEDQYCIYNTSRDSENPVLISKVDSSKLRAQYFLISAKNKRSTVLNWGKIDDIPTLSNVSVELMNSNFSCGFNINQRKFSKLLKGEYPDLDISFNPDDKYHGIKIRWPCEGIKIFISVFRTGSVLMTAAKSSHQLDAAYNFINTALKKYYKKIWAP